MQMPKIYLKLLHFSSRKMLQFSQFLASVCSLCALEALKSLDSDRA